VISVHVSVWYVILVGLVPDIGTCVGLVPDIGTCVGVEYIGRRSVWYMITVHVWSGM